MLDEFTKARIRRVVKRINGEQHKGRFRPSTKRLKEIAQHGNDLILSATDKELSGFSE
ncbi:hypothetical protein [Zhongshania sp.]|uniref:hypothetical protein n=1 Tax=Zhongshania sp. TaxID=1971902 RepID=UPI00356494C2